MLPTPWKLATIAAGVLSAALSVLLLLSYLENRHLTKEVAALNITISAPNTGWAARLAQSQTNAVTLQTAIDNQNNAQAALAAQTEAKLTKTNAELAKVKSENQRLAKRVAILSAPLKTGTLVDRVAEVDARVLETLK